jgi:hypothetical protein
MLKEFFAVTRTSIYHVQDRGQNGASAVKVALRGCSKIRAKTDIANGGMIAICHNLHHSTLSVMAQVKVAALESTRAANGISRPQGSLRFSSTKWPQRLAWWPKTQTFATRVG